MNSKQGILVTSRIPNDLCSVLVAAPGYNISICINCIYICVNCISISGVLNVYLYIIQLNSPE